MSLPRAGPKVNSSWPGWKYCLRIFQPVTAAQNRAMAGASEQSDVMVSTADVMANSAVLRAPSVATVRARREARGRRPKRVTHPLSPPLAAGATAQLRDQATGPPLPARQIALR